MVLENGWKPRLQTEGKVCLAVYLTLNSEVKIEILKMCYSHPGQWSLLWLFFSIANKNLCRFTEVRTKYFHPNAGCLRSCYRSRPKQCKISLLGERQQRICWSFVVRAPPFTVKLDSRTFHFLLFILWGSPWLPAPLPPRCESGFKHFHCNSDEE